MKFAIFLSIMTLVVLIQYTVGGNGRRDTREKRIYGECDKVNGPVVEQWVSCVKDVSSEHFDGYEACQIIGEPDIYPSYGDNEGAWQQYSDLSTDIEWIIVQVPNTVCVTNLDLYETYNSGHVTMIEALFDSGFVTLWKAPNGVTPLTVSRIFTPTLQIAGCVCSETIRITTEPNRIGWINIDAVNIVGEDTCYG